MDALGAAIEELLAAYPGRYPGRDLQTRAAAIRQRLVALAAGRLDPADPPAAKLLGELEALRREALVAENPLLAGKKLLLVKRYTYDSNHYYDEFIAGIRRFGGGFYVLSLADGTVAEVAPALARGHRRSLRPLLRRPADRLRLQAAQVRRIPHLRNRPWTARGCGN